jgi:arylsulfatase A-like enzyme
MPFVVRWPGKVKAGVSEAMVSQVDFLSSFAALVGQPVDPSDVPDSQNVLAALLGNSEKGRSHVVEHAWGLAVRKGDWKYIPPGRIQDQLGPWKQVDIPQPGFLFDLIRDPGETNNLALTRPDKVNELAALLEEIRHNERGEK